MTKLKPILAVLALGSLSVSGWAHEKHKNDRETVDPAQINTTTPEQQVSALDLINKSYTDQVKPIFKTKCFDCHSNQTKYPWYYQIPGVKQLIDHDIKEAREHMDMSNDFPFAGFKSDTKALEELKEVVDEDEMPPFIYTMMHRNTKLTDNDKKIIQDWIASSLHLLQTSATTPPPPKP